MGEELAQLWPLKQHVSELDQLLPELEGHQVGGVIQSLERVGEERF